MRNVWATTFLLGLAACAGDVKRGDTPSDEPSDDAPSDEPSDEPSDDSPSDDTPSDDPSDDSPADIDAGPPGERNDAPARLIPGGGVGNAPLWEVLHVHVIDERTGAPIDGAEVTVGERTGTTGADGKTSFDDASLRGPLEVSATAAGHAGTTWIGVDGANLTVALLPTEAIPSARVTGSLTLPNPPLGDYSLGVVLSTFTADISAAENQLPQPLDGDTPANVMIRSLLGNDGDFELTTRTGRQRVYAIVVLGDTNGTNEDLSDDILTVSRVSVAEGFSLATGQSQAAPAFTDITAAGMQDFSVSFAGAPAGLGDIVAFPVVDLGADGKLVLPLPPMSPERASTKVPPATGVLAGSYEVVALASPPGDATTPFSTIVKRNVSGSADLGAWLGVPTAISGSGTAYSYTPPAGASFVSGQFARADGSVVWTVVVLAGSSISLPAAPGEASTLQVAVREVPGFDARDFSLPQVKASFTRASGAEAAVSP